ncbi:4-(cytidine 5'-diphospho)-2-C-methyl-D-erythritol kinase [Tomitella fengzijianii]|uniref:4-(cytidine 5'-diphospho)-2-C-methyl-D-erythritol kinase n=1 Tax=Tomitella fengzijianii TaxID=2597660 RepID=UPI00131C7C37|nr:4-(cytidine 5'-diphospho)-2-C-methyl-D-erythritol kinase [Tomitella fengzijianii]
MLTVVHEPVVVQVPAKVNLHLGVGDPRPDGYHELATVFQALSLHDTVSVVPAHGLEVRVRGEGSRFVPTDNRNLAWRAAEALAAHVGREPKARITVDKGIPVAGGMAGGSADAAGTLVALDAMWGLDLPREDLRRIAAGLGSDVPFILLGGTALGTGRGEDLTTVLTRNSCHWVLAFAKGGLSTPDVFAELDRLRAKGLPDGPGDDAQGRRQPGLRRLGSADDLLQALAAGDASRLGPVLGNDLQAAALSLRPDLRRTLAAGERAGALRGIVSGSGPTCAFLCADEDAALAVSLELAGEGVCRTVRVASGPVPGARVLGDDHDDYDDPEDLA